MFSLERDEPRESTRRAVSSGLVLRAVLDEGPLARSHIARRTGLSPASVTDHCYALLGSGLLTEVQPRRSRKAMGRPTVPLDLNTDVGVVGGIHYAAEHATVALVDLRGTVLAERLVRHDGADAGTIVTRSGDVLVELLHREASTLPTPLLGVGVASGGWVDPDRGMIVEHDVLGWQRIPVAELLQDRLGVPVCADSHVRTLLRAEQLFGRSESRASVLGLFVGNIVDAGFALGERPHHGARSRAGAVAHRAVPGSTVPCDCGRTGCLQATVSEWRLVARARELGLIERQPEPGPAARPAIFDLLDVLRAGDPTARSLFVERAELVGQAVAPLIDMFSPDLVLVIEPGITYLPECRTALHRQIAAHSFTVADPSGIVVGSSFMEHALATAGATAFLDALYRDPLGAVPSSRAS
ncbi:ROK family protein [Cryptosporangium aurantiacum]|uniref:Sugar kinase of the NBD/HSP70 family, may contain an N-terminal HTH domain n=1 Tax=Cryptosporangium aurantiacum TaxID=134849 RepID=A0A1M7RJQ0_9ACTN|nr:ROK family protein [Cryptosporangium aurantiacum]SHN46298.1 Sugar kinase of the NBD/HSP70 family, may contain an N-terminal HTH domain [Cryptosporangium aurantiacum]